MGVIRTVSSVELPQVTSYTISYFVVRVKGTRASTLRKEHLPISQARIGSVDVGGGRALLGHEIGAGHRALGHVGQLAVTVAVSQIVRVAATSSSHP